jgi:hypothetical protein
LRLRLSQQSLQVLPLTLLAQMLRLHFLELIHAAVELHRTQKVRLPQKPQ